MPTKTFFIAIAADLRIDRRNLLRDASNPAQPACLAGFDLAVETMCANFKRANPAFDKQRFLDAVNKAPDGVSINSPELAAHPVAQANAASWPSGPKARKA